MKTPTVIFFVAAGILYTLVIFIAYVAFNLIY
jgi:hypothetical protein